MSEHDLEKLLGGFAADTLTPEEKQRLYSAALQDQHLFDALADEQALKELLTDPAVRLRLLQTLQRTSTSGAGGSAGWLGWFRRPSGLAWAGGLAAAVFAVVLGTKIYQDSLKQAAQSVATEEAKLTSPPASAPPASQPSSSQTAEPQLKSNENTESSALPSRKDISVEKPATREKSAGPIPSRQEQEYSTAARDRGPVKSERGELPKKAETPAAPLGKTAEEATASADQKPAASPAPSAILPESKPMQAPAGGARTLFYGDTSRTDIQEADGGRKPLAQSAPERDRLERKRERVAAATEQTAGLIQPLKPLGLRYSVLSPDTGSRDPETAAGSLTQSQPPRLTVEANQDCYIQILAGGGSSSPRLLFPDQQRGQISSKLVAGQRRSIPLPEETSTITIRLARTPFDSMTGQAPATSADSFPHQLQETTTADANSDSGMGTGPSRKGASPQQTTYVVNQDPSIGELSVTIPLDRP